MTPQIYLVVYCHLSVILTFYIFCIDTSVNDPSTSSTTVKTAYFNNHHMSITVLY